MMKQKLILALLAAGLILVSAGCASTNKELTVTEVWARPGLADGNTGVFFVIDNPGAEDRLLQASSTAAKVVELHQTRMEDGVMKMQMQEYVLIPEGSEVVFKPGDYHVMLMGLVDDLAVGDTFEVVLVFEQAGEIPVSVEVMEP